MKSVKKALIIGASGFIGRYLANYLARQGQKVVATYHRTLPASHNDKSVRFIKCDVTKKAGLLQVIRQQRPDEIYYLAARSSIRRSWLEPEETFKVNFLGGLYLFGAIGECHSQAKVLVVSSCTIYGATYRSHKRISEESALNPLDPYSLSKCSLDILGRLYASVLGHRIVIARLTNVTGPGQSTIFSVPNIAKQISQIERNQRPRVVKVGNLDSKRDYLDIRDCVRALYLIMQKGKVGQAYNVSSGSSIRLAEVLSQMIKLSRVKKNGIKIQKNSDLIAKDEIQAIELKSEKLRRLTGWRPQISFRDTLRDVLNEFRKT